MTPRRKTPVKPTRADRPAPSARPAPTARVAPRGRPVVLRGATLQHQAHDVLERLRREYPHAHTELHHHTAYELLVATILSAQTTDVRVNMVTPALFARYPDPAALAVAEVTELEEIIRSTGFFHAKAKSLVGMAHALVDRFGSTVPASMDELVSLPGVGRKTANVVLGDAFGRQEGVVVDTHVGRLAIRLGLTRETDPVKVEQVLMRLIPRADWTLISHLLIFHGRRVCTARAPACERCVLGDICPSKALFTGKGSKKTGAVKTAAAVGR